MDAFFSEFRWVGELLGFLKDIVVVVAVVYGLRSIVVAQKQLVLTQQELKLSQEQVAIQQKASHDVHERASKEAALRHAEMLASNEFDESLAELDKSVADHAMKPFNGDVAAYSVSKLSAQERAALDKRQASVKYEAVFDKLEIFAAAHLVGVADDDTGFRLNGPYYCQVVHDSYDLLCWEREKGFYSVVEELYRDWSKRLSRPELERAAKEAKERFEALSAQLKQDETKTRPIGT